MKTEIFEKGSYVFLPDEEQCYLPAKVVATFEKGKPGQVQLVDSGRTVRISAKHSAQTQSMDKQSLQRWPDMVVLKQLDNASLLYNIRLRYEKDEIYSSIGSILVSVNPYKQLPELFGPEMTDRYIACQGDVKDMDPHIYGVAEETFYQMITYDEDQSCIITGESGAGKTEATKLFLQYIAERSRRNRGRASSFEEFKGEDERAFDVPLREQILGANPIMEAFGNAKTVRNDNSSRFGKLISVQFLRSVGCVAGGQITNYLLEKSRVVRHLEGERSYHIFYQLCTAANQTDPSLKQKFKLLDADQYFYLNQSQQPSTMINGVDDAREWEETLKAMSLLKMSDEQQEDVFRVLAGILHLGNIEFKPVSGTSDFAKVDNKPVLDLAAEMFGVTPEELERGLLTRDISNKKERVIQKHNVREAGDSRDALAKHTYSRLFNWLTGRINMALSSRLDGRREDDIRSINVLDIFGFESFLHNSFEQLCINYCNEQLQQFFNNHIFKLEQEEYRRENIDVSQIGFSDNAGVLATIDHRSHGIFAICDDEVNLLRGTDDGFLNKVLNQARQLANKAKADAARPPAPPGRGSGTSTESKESDSNSPSPSPRSESFVGKVRRRASSFHALKLLGGGGSNGGANGSNILGDMDSPHLANTKVFLKEPDVKVLRKNTAARQAFIVVHFAGEVMYNVEGFLEKNRDVLRDDLLDVVSSSKYDLVRDLFEDASSSRTNKSARKTLGRKFQEQLDRLMLRLGVTEPHFVRTIKPNAQKRPHIFEARLVLDQLRYAGLLEVCRIRQMGYPIRKEFKEFFYLYKCIHPEAKDIDHLIDLLLQDKLLEGREWQKGKTKVFMRAAQFDTLQNTRGDALKKVVVTMQKNTRMFLQRSRYNRIRSVFDDLERGIETRDKKLLENSISFAAGLPNAGKHVLLLERARRVLAELKEQEAHLARIEAAVEGGDVDSLKSLVATAENMGLGKEPIVQQAKDMIKRDKEEKACMEQLQLAIESRDIEKLSLAVERAHELKMGGTNECKTARALLDRLEEEEKLLAQLSEAMDRKDIAAMQDLVQALVDLGSGDHVLVLKAQRMTKKIVQESKARKEALEKLNMDLEEAMDNRDLDRLNELRIRIQELGAKGPLIDQAMELRQRLEDRQKLLHKIQVEMGLLSQKARTLEGLKEDDLNPLQAAVDTARKEDLTEDNEPEVRAAVKFLERMEEQLEVQIQLKEALIDKNYSQLLAALLAAQRLGMETADSREVSDQIRHLEQIKLALCEKDNAERRNRIFANLVFATKEEKDQIDRDRLDKMNSEEYLKLMEDCNIPDKYELHLYYRIRSDDDYTESFAPRERAHQANMKLWSNREPIPKSLHELDNSQNIIATRCNRYILTYCGDLGQSFNKASLAQHLVIQGMLDERVGDEIYIQLLKHIRGNPSESSVDSAWLLMCACTKYFPPSDVFAPYLVYNLLEYRTRPKLIGNYARLCIAQLGPTLETERPGKFKPDTDELAQYNLRPPVLIPVQVVDGSIVELPVSPDQRIESVMKLVRRKTGILDAVKRPAWAVFVQDKDESNNDGLRDRLVNFYKHYNTSKLAHIEVYVSHWKGREDELFERLVKQYGPEPGVQTREKKSGSLTQKPILRLPVTAALAAGKFLRLNHSAPKRGPSPTSEWPLPTWSFPGDVYLRMAKQGREPVFVFKRRFFPEKGKADIWLYQQLVRDVGNGVLPIQSEHDLAELAGIALAHEHEDDIDLANENDIIDKGLSRHIPKSWLAEGKPLRFWAKKIANQVVVPNGQSVLRQKYVDICKNQIGYGMVFFNATKADSRKDYMIGVDSNGLHVLSPAKDDLVRTFPLKAIKKFGAQSGSFWMKIKKSALKQSNRASRKMQGGIDPAANSSSGGSKFDFLKRKDGIDVQLDTLQAWELFDVVWALKHLEVDDTKAPKKTAA